MKSGQVPSGRRKAGPCEVAWPFDCILDRTELSQARPAALLQRGCLLPLDFASSPPATHFAHWQPAP